MKRRNMIILAIAVAMILLGIAWSQKGETVEPNTEKQKFIITTISLGNEGTSGAITKSTTVQGASDITINAQAAGRIVSANVKLGESVESNQLLVSMTDTAGSYAFGAQRAALSLESAQNSFVINQQNIEKQIQDAQIAYQKTLLSTNNTSLGNNNSTANLQIKQLEQNLAKAQIDYVIKLKTDEQTLNNYTNTAINIYSDITNLLLDVIDSSDKFLGYTVENAHLNNGFEIYISVKDTNTKNIAEMKLADLIRKKDDLILIGNNITLENINSYLSQYKEIVTSINEMTVAMKNVLNTTIPGGSLTQAGLEGYVGSFTALQSRASGISSSITSQVNGMNSFVNTYKDNQESLKQQVASLETQIAVSKKQIEESSINASYTLEQTKNNIDFLKSTQDNNLNALRTSLSQAQVAYQEAQFNLGKFSIKSPIPGTISEILVDKGQEVSPGTPLIKMVSRGKEAVLKLTAGEVTSVQIGQEVIVSYRGVRVPGIVSEIGTIADATGNYPVKIAITETADIDIGQFVEIEIPLEQGSSIIPINAVKIVDNNRGQVFLRDGTTIINKVVELGSVYGNGIEITEDLPESMELIISDISNYDPASMEIQKK